jgi:hypothetical protein
MVFSVSSRLGPERACRYRWPGSIEPAPKPIAHARPHDPHRDPQSATMARRTREGVELLPASMAKPQSSIELRADALKNSSIACSEELGIKIAEGASVEIGAQHRNGIHTWG